MRVLAAVLAGLLAAGVARAAPFRQLIVFGDSLSDVGNDGRATASYLWGEHVAGGWGLVLKPSKAGGTDYAYGGALITAGSPAVPSLPQQVQRYLARHPHADAGALYVIWGGGNDVLSTLQGGAGGLAHKGVDDTVAMVRALYAAGARRFLIGGVPRTDLTPYVRGLGQAAMAQQQGLVQEWNNLLRPALGGLVLAGGSVRFYDSAATLVGVVRSPTHYGFRDWTTPCGQGCGDPAHTFFYDQIHPGATGHVMIADAVLALASQ